MNTIIVGVLLALCVAGHAATTCDGTAFQIVDDVELDRIVEEAVSDFLATRPTPITQLGVTLLWPSQDAQGNKIWQRGSSNPYLMIYPASTVKLAYMAASVQWCHQQQRPSDCIDQHVRPMVKNSDNLQTGVVVDICSAAPNINITSAASNLFAPWLARRHWASDYLEDHQLLGAQNISLKTYPTNTGQTLWGAEGIQKTLYGSNAMCAQCAASLMLEVSQGALYGEEATQYMRGLLSHAPWSSESAFGFGVPPGTVLRNKIGVAYDNLNDIALFTLPSGQEFILAAYSNGYEPSQPYPYDGSNLGSLVYFITQRLPTTPCTPPTLQLTVSSNFHSVGKWTNNSSPQCLAGECVQTADSGATAGWDVQIPSTGIYEVSIWSPQDQTYSPSITVTVTDSTGTYPWTITQQSYGGRWYKLGDFYYVKGNHQNSVSIQAGSTGITVANAIRLTKWPECHGAPAATCQDYQPSGPTCLTRHL